jgi:hypothetical protein
VAFVWPFVALALPWGPRHLILVEIAIIYSMRFLLAWRFRTSMLGAVLHPLGLLLALAIGINSWIRSSRGGVVWKGRRYTLSPRSEIGLMRPPCNRDVSRHRGGSFAVKFDSNLFLHQFALGSIWRAFSPSSRYTT